MRQEPGDERYSYIRERVDGLKEKIEARQPQQRERELAIKWVHGIVDTSSLMLAGCMRRQLVPGKNAVSGGGGSRVESRSGRHSLATGTRVHWSSSEVVTGTWLSPGRGPARCAQVP